MGRPSSDLGVGGNIYYSAYSAGWRARCRYRDRDGVLRHVERSGPSRTAARAALQRALRDRVRVAVGDGEITGETKVSVLAEEWYREQQKRDLSPNTFAAYRLRLDQDVVPNLGAPRIRQLTVGVADRFVQAVADKRGPGAAKMAKAVLSGMCKMAARLDATDRNVVREVGPIASAPKEQPRALPVAQLRRLRALLTYDARARSRDLPDLLDLLMASGARIGEVRGLVWDAVDREAGTIEIRSTVVRVKGVGLVNRPKPKTRAGYRRIQLPVWAVDILTRRYRGQDGSAVVFPAQRGGPRDPNNTQADIREAMATAGLAGLTSHVIGRKSVATLLDDSGQSARQIADVLGHADPSLTMNTYMGRKVTNPHAADALAVLAF